MQTIWPARSQKTQFIIHKYRRALTNFILMVLLILLVLVLGYGRAAGETPFGTIYLVTRLEIDHYRFSHPADLASDPLAGSLLYLESANGALHTISPFGNLISSVETDVTAGRLDFDARTGDLLFIDSVTGNLLRIAQSQKNSAKVLAALPAQQIAGLAVDPDSGDVYYIDGQYGLLKRITAAQLSAGPLAAAPLAPQVIADDVHQLQGLAIHPLSGHLFSLVPGAEQVIELAANGDQIKIYDLAPFNLPALTALAFAPSTDQTDAPQVFNLYVAGGKKQTDIWELRFTPPKTPTMAAAPGTLIQTINVWQFDPPSPDGSGVTYLPNANRLLETDSEVNEKTIYQGVNQFEMTLQGTLVNTYDTTHFSNEPTGIAYDPDRNHLFLSDDDMARVNEVDMNYNLVRSFSVSTISGRAVDAEGITYNTWNGRLYLAGGTSSAVFWIDPGPNNDFGDGDDLHGWFPSTGISDPEGIAFNTSNGNLFLTGRNEVIEYSIAGATIQVIDIRAANPQKPAGAAYGPSSTGGGNSIYISDRGQDDDSSINGGRGDGRVYEFAIGSVTLPDPPTAAFSATNTSGPAPLSVNFNNNSAGSFYSCSWDFGDSATSSDCGNPVHNYTTPGTYTVSLTVTGAGGADIETKTNYVQVIQPAVAAFSGAPQTVDAPDWVTFTNNSSGSYSTCTWDFGDGGSSSSCAAKVDYEYTTPGTYDVSLTVNGAGGLSSETKLGYITVNATPAVNFKGTPLTYGPAPLPVTFVNTSTASGNPCDWDFDADNPGTSTGSDCTNINHTYTSAGTYSVALVITGVSTTDVLTKTNYIKVGVPVAANFSETPTSGTAPQLVTFSNTSTGDYDVCHWDYGDGETSTSCGPNVNHTYTKIGVFPVSLTVSGIGGVNTQTKNDLITIEHGVTADFHAAPTAGPAPQTVQFSNLSSGNFTSCTWTFGDGGTSTDCGSPSHQYTAAGTFTVSLSVSGPGGSDTATKTNHIDIAVPVTADFSGTPTSGVAPLTTSFTNLSTGDFNSCFWEFGDGSTGVGCGPQSHDYLSGGHYTVSLTASGPGGSEIATKVDYIVVTEASGAGFDAAPKQGIAPLLVNFTNLSSGDYSTCTWDFGDGLQSNLCANPAHTYTTPGSFSVTLVIDGSGGPSSKTMPNLITVYDPVVADFSGTPTTGVVPYTVIFTNLSSGDFLNCAWDFGDGATSSECYNVSHPYTATGAYSVSLQVSGQGGTDTKLVSNYVTVDEPTVDFSAAPLAGSAPLVVNFHNLSIGHFDTCLWQFGDGATSTACAAPSHTYTEIGAYTVELTMSGASGNKTTQKVNYINVGEDISEFIIYMGVIMSE